MKVRQIYGLGVSFVNNPSSGALIGRLSRFSLCPICVCIQERQQRKCKGTLKEKRKNGKESKAGIRNMEKRKKRVKDEILRKEKG